MRPKPPCEKPISRICCGYSPRICSGTAALPSTRPSSNGWCDAYAAVMGITWLLDLPTRIRARLGTNPGELRPRDPRIAGDEILRAPVQMLANLLNLWATRTR